MTALPSCSSLGNKEEFQHNPHTAESGRVGREGGREGNPSCQENPPEWDFLDSLGECRGCLCCIAAAWGEHWAPTGACLPLCWEKPAAGRAQQGWEQLAVLQQHCGNSFLHCGPALGVFRSKLCMAASRSGSLGAVVLSCHPHLNAAWKSKRDPPQKQDLEPKVSFFKWWAGTKYIPSQKHLWV